MNRIIFLLSVLLISACSTVPEPIQIADNVPLVNFSNVLANPEAENVIGEKARWGGRIVSVENKKDVSEIEIIYFPESGSGKPRLSEASPGRFKAVVNGFIDPLVFEPDRVITVIGTVNQPQNGIIGEQNYTYPTVEAIGYYMWKQQSDVRVEQIGFSPFMYGPFFHRGYAWSAWSPWYDPFYHQRTRYRVIQKHGHSQGATVNQPRSNQVNRSNSTNARSTASVSRPSYSSSAKRARTKAPENVQKR
uniref:Slp family lipoprotein n=1 Tax=Ningiella ruwaisensis TaxID=2364274 RepID=UPI0010A0066E|nr:Slp family lipoprotein [Ningiella ruwaisensis]